MPRFRYRARTSTGEELSGELTAGDEDLARHSLESSEMVVLELEPLEVAAAPGEEAAGTESPRDLTTAQTGQFVDQLAATTAGGLPLEDTLEALADDSDDPHVAEALRQLAARLRSGMPLEDATAMFGSRLPPRIRGLLAAGVRCGNPAAVFGAYVRMQMTARAASHQIASAIAFPLVILLVAIPIMLFFVLYLIPQFESLFREFDLVLPELTVLAIRFAEILPTILLVVAVAAGAMWVVARLGTASGLVARLRSALPLLGQLWIWSGHRELAATLGTLISLRIPLSESLLYTANLLEDQNLARACRRASAEAETGASLSDCLSRSIHFDRMFTALVRWGEQHNLVAGALDHATRFYAERIDQQAALVRRVLPPLLLMALTMSVVLIVISLFIPLVSLISGLT